MICGKRIEGRWEHGAALSRHSFVKAGGLLQRHLIDATKKFNISLTEKRFVHFRLSRASL
ncbi:hypothetical protein CWI35_11925 [[Bacillus] caldolyticus]|uniref:Uncharacterized protein n=1 Tax=Bacillus caldolyticus TaxID=1394 RepID=A0ABN5FXP6_BACCL|nr:hypothetical protein CWI35_11925 [[Bacillus] caldolyticus]PJW13923.1 hypothetical protein CV945_11445 [Geobacillus sp. Manikaran-105]PJW16924.1 hypothetical protein CV944_11815 [Geobacillus sp. WSUCF-018B]TLS32741.1 hypothetical protein FDK15_12050 [Geobacillus thermoleovorans]